MNNKQKKALYESIMNAVAKTIKKQLNEGAGAGYTVGLKGVKLTNFKVASYTSLDKYGNSIREFTADIAPGIVEWSADGYYDGVSSKGLYYNDEVLEYSDDDKTIKGGVVKGYIDVSDVTDYSDYDYKSDVKKSYIKYLKDFASTIDVYTMYGSGYSHVNLGSPEFTLKDIDIEGYNSDIHINTITVNAPDIADNINWFFANVNDFDEIFSNENND